MGTRWLLWPLGGRRNEDPSVRTLNPKGEGVGTMLGSALLLAVGLWPSDLIAIVPHFS